jgi:hypothetical protein
LKPLREKRAILKIQRKIAQGKKIVVAFVVFDPAIWKYHSLYTLLDSDPKYRVYVIIAKKNKIPTKDRDELYIKAYEFFSSMYRIIVESNPAYKIQRRYSKLINPNIIVYSIPYTYLDSPFLIKSNLKRINIYGIYGLNVTNRRFVVDNYYNYLVNRLYIESDLHLIIYNKLRKLKANNMTISGPLKADQFEYGVKDNYYIWKREKNKRLIWAPHWRIESYKDDATQGYFGNFLKYYKFFQEMAVKYRNEITICLKPHPLLKSMLYTHDEWGPNRTDEYFDFWKSSNNTMLEEGDYFDLFNSSDGMIHDSGSFIGEYIYTGKPVAFIANDTIANLLNEFAKIVLENIVTVTSKREIEDFIVDLINDVDKKKFQRESIYNKYLKENHHHAAYNVKIELENFLGI